MIKESLMSTNYLKPISVEMLRNRFWLKVTALPKLNVLIVNERDAEKDSTAKILGVENFLKSLAAYHFNPTRTKQKALQGSQFDFDQPTSIAMASKVRRSLFGSMHRDIKNYVRWMLSLEGVFSFSGLLHHSWHHRACRRDLRTKE